MLMTFATVIRNDPEYNASVPAEKQKRVLGFSINTKRDVTLEPDDMICILADEEPE